MDLNSSPSNLSNGETLDFLTNSQEDRLFAKYMRFSPSPGHDSSKAHLECYNDRDDLNEDDEIEDDDPPAQVPLSSSPPDFTSSSPQSYSLGSQDSETCSTLTPISSDLDLEVDVLGRRQLNVSAIELSEPSVMNDFPQRLHRLLFAILDKRWRLMAPSPSRYDTGTQHDFLSESDGSKSFVSASSGSGFWHSALHPDKSEVDEPHEDCDERGMPTPSGDENRSPTRLQNYRIIKRARSNISYESAEDTTEWPNKRQKTRNEDVSRAKPRIYAHRAASLRRAESLKVDASTKKANNYVETVPVTPVPEASDHRNHTQRRSQSISKNQEKKEAIRAPVPVIAPPLGHSAKFPLNAEQIAKRRLFSLLEREHDGRERDGLYVRICRGPRSNSPSNIRCEALSCLESSRVNITSEWEAALGLGRQDREEAVEWLLEVMPKSPSRASSHSTSVSASTKTTTSNTPQSSGGKSDTSQCTPSCRSTSSISMSVNRAATLSSSLSNLEDQLAHSPDTRFHAVYLLLRYFHLCMRKEGSKQPKNPSLSRTSSVDTARSHATDSEGLNLILWDVAIACLSVSVKFHRDFLDPLLPVFAHEYLALAPHEMSYEDLETAHRDILSAFGYRLGVTPQPIMDELWLALPSLRVLLQFDGGWEHATSHTWSILFMALDGEAVFPAWKSKLLAHSFSSVSSPSSPSSSQPIPEPDILRFPVSMLTIVALMEGVVQSLAVYSHGKQMKKTERYGDGQGPYLTTLALQRRFRKKARQESEGVLCDIQALTGITDAELMECCAWIRNLG